MRTQSKMRSEKQPIIQRKTNRQKATNKYLVLFTSGIISLNGLIIPEAETITFLRNLIFTRRAENEQVKYPLDIPYLTHCAKTK